ncbi:hypothetical protein EBB07_25400 [Paenibacillaceae bacterium]|nr:hypothetical protein EBB07_25400 [Paenibacillaceae bacterium]
MSDNNRERIILLMAALLPFISIFFSSYQFIRDHVHTLGFPIRFLYYYGATFPEHKYQLFTWKVFTSSVSLQMGLYALNVVLIYVVLALLNKRFRTNISGRQGR